MMMIKDDKTVFNNSNTWTFIGRFGKPFLLDYAMEHQCVSQDGIAELVECMLQEAAKHLQYDLIIYCFEQYRHRIGIQNLHSMKNIAIDNGDVKMLEFFFKESPIKHQQQSVIESYITKSIKHGHVSVLELIIKQLDNETVLTQIKSKVMSPLTLDLVNGNDVHMFKYLLDIGVRIDVKAVLSSTGYQSNKNIQLIVDRIRDAIARRERIQGQRLKHKARDSNTYN
ncbi:hypothetical protein SAMD00019534_015340, partial [Acytostelium subglobosum LB1]|uniref:hypothetical protein n=1 Tax=Acytostelium subglobosum LB1 TaxID=1410327 RepID=UPI000644CB03